MKSALITKELKDLERLLISKHEAYGNIDNPSNIFSELDSVEAVKVRVDDKLRRIKNKGFVTANEDTLTDLIGYLVLLKVMLKNSK